MASQIPRAPRCRFSVAMIVCDEADLLADSVQSVRPIADEIVVLDTGSADPVPALAEEPKVTVHKMPWADDFSAARNRLLEKVTGDWVLWLDAGEQLDADSAADLRRFVDAKADPGKVYMLWLEVPPAEASGSAEQAARLRLMPKHPGLRFAGRVCESVFGAVEAAGLQFDAAPGRIVRHPRLHEPDRMARTARRSLRLIELAKAERGEASPRMLLAAAEAHADLGNPAAARNAFTDALEAAEHGSLEMLEGYYGLLSTLGSDPAQQQQQLTVCLEALEIFPLDAQLLCAMGNYLQGRNQLDLAARAFQTAVAYGQVNVETWHLREIAELAAACLGLVLQLQGKDDEACRVLEESLGRQPGSVRLRRHLVNLLVKQGRQDEAIRHAGPLETDPVKRDALRDAVRGACSAASRNWLPAVGYLQSALAAGCDDVLCLRWLAVTLLSNGQTEAAEPVLCRWLRREPNNAEAQRYVAAIRRPAVEDAPTPSEDEPSRRLRIDAGQTASEAAPTQAPGAGQTPTAGSAPTRRTERA